MLANRDEWESFLLSLVSFGLIDVVCLVFFRYRFLASQPAEDVSARVVVDGVPYRESIGSYALLSRHVNSGILERDLVLNLQVRAAIQTLNAPALPLMIKPITGITSRVVVSTIDMPYSFLKGSCLKPPTIKTTAHPTTSTATLDCFRHPPANRQNCRCERLSFVASRVSRPVESVLPRLLRMFRCCVIWLIRQESTPLW